MQSNLRKLDGDDPPGALHVAIVMDGNGRWAERRGWPRGAGHRAGADAVGRVVEAAPRLGIGTLTLFAFSSDNWRRPPAEVGILMELFRDHLRREALQLVRDGVRLRIIGRRDRLPPDLAGAIADAEACTRDGTHLNLRIALDYSSRHAIAEAALEAIHDGCVAVDSLATSIAGRDPGGDVDLLIRTGGEMRLSDFLLWECAYAEMVFRRVAWPDFHGFDLADAVAEFHGRQRRFGGLPSHPFQPNAAAPLPRT